MVPILFLLSFEPDADTLKARAALALAFAEPTYAGQYAKALKAGKPLLVWVNQPERKFEGCIGFACKKFPGIDKPTVIVGVPNRDGLNRIDLSGTPTDAIIRAALTEAVRPGTRTILPRETPGP